METCNGEYFYSDSLIFSRQNITNLPAGNDYSQAAKGAYIVAGSDENPDVILVASGSEVSTLVAGAELLRKDGIKLRIVSAPSEGLFRNQAPGYQESIIPANAKVFGLTAGLPVTLEDLSVLMARFGDWNHSVSPLPTRCWTKSWALRQKTYTSK